VDSITVRRSRAGGMWEARSGFQGSSAAVISTDCLCARVASLPGPFRARFGSGSLFDDILTIRAPLAVTIHRWITWIIRRRVPLLIF
jgi:hypothetical protein